MKRLAVSAVLAVVLLVGCGEDPTLSAADISDAFRERTGDALVRDSGMSNASWDSLDFPEGSDEDGRLTSAGHDLAGKYGAFSVYVVHDDEAYDTLLDGEGPDENGIYWKRDDDLGYVWWSATKRYGNIVITWQAGEARETDRTWDRLDGIFTAMHDDAAGD